MSELMRSASLHVATLIDRRRFLRRIAGGTFAGFAALASGRLISPGVAFAYASYCEPVAGSGCPSGCGPSPCCYHLSDSSCHCSDGHGGCIYGRCCDGKVGGLDWEGKSCWTCSRDECIGPCRFRVSTTCCDCKVTCSLCGTDKCIAFVTTYTVIGVCADDCHQTVGTLAGVATGDPATSWGMQPQLAP